MENLPWLIHHFKKREQRAFSIKDEEQLLEIIKKSPHAEEIVLACQLLGEDDESKIIPLCKRLNELPLLNLQLLLAYLGTCNLYEIFEYLLDFYFLNQDPVNQALCKEGILRAGETMSLLLLTRYSEITNTEQKKRLADLLKQRGFDTLIDFLSQSQTVPFEVELRACFGNDIVGEFLASKEKNSE